MVNIVDAKKYRKHKIIKESITRIGFKNILDSNTHLDSNYVQ